MKKQLACFVLSLIYISAYSQIKCKCSTMPDSMAINYPIESILEECGEAKGIAIIEHLMFVELNIIRKGYHLPLFTLNTTLSKAAHKHAENMRLRKFFDHEDPELGDPKTRAEKAGFKGARVGENIARGNWSVKDVFKDWMNSPSHKPNIISTSFKLVGLGFSGCIANNKDNKSCSTYFVNEFGKMEW